MSKSYIFLTALITIFLFSINTNAQDSFYNIDELETLTTVTKETNLFKADLKLGIIGKTDLVPFDNPIDNTFTVTIEESLSNCSNVYLKYSVFGVEGKNSISKSINTRLATGGYLVKTNNKWINQKEEIDKNWLKQGENQITFRIPIEANYHYKIKDLTIVIEKNDNSDCNEIVIKNTEVNTKIEDKIYVKGFIQNIDVLNYTVFCNNQKMNVYGNEYEGFVNLENKKSKNLLVEVKEGKKIIVSKKIVLKDLAEANYQFFIEKEQSKSSKLFLKNKAFNFAINGASIMAPDSALVVSKEIFISKMRSIDISPLPQGMVNVTNGGAYRFLPDGTQFNKQVKLTLAYDISKIPNGYSEKDIVTYFFNTKTKKWTAIEKEDINKDKQVLTSLTTHFTDYINGIIKTPESPQSNSFTPTMMSGLKAATPTSGMNIINVPSANQIGDANLSYPIKIPSGRNGMQPNLAIQYNSSGGNGWLGEGWNLSVPSIAVETRWGTPTFQPEKESEMYTFAGEQLMYPKVNYNGGFEDYMPNRYRGDINGSYTTDLQARNYGASNGITRFGLRKHDPTTKIERLGTETSNYYWKVTNSTGTISWYGGDENGINENSIIRQEDGDIVHWALRKNIDVYGNNVIYKYNNQVLSIAAGDANENLNLSKVFNIESIIYTGKDDTLGNYTVNFFNETEINRKNIQMNFRRGVKEVTPYRLDRIEVSYNDDLIRKYQLTYKEGAFRKSLLDKITALDPNDAIFNEHVFEYYDDTTDGLFDFENPIDMDSGNGDFDPDYFLNFGEAFNTSILSSDESREGGFSVRLAAGVEFIYPTNKPNRNIIIGSTAGKNWLKGNGMILLIDIDGDGLDDLVFRGDFDDEGLYFKKHVIENNVHLFQEKQKIGNINYFQKYTGKTIMPIGQSWDVAASVVGSAWDSALASRSITKTTAETHIYLTDANRDGLIDVVKPSSEGDPIVYFNHLENGVPTFSPDSSITPNLVLSNLDQEPVIPEIIDPLQEDEEALQTQLSFDIVKVWIAPQDGNITIEDEVFFATTPEANESITYSIETTNPNSNQPNKESRLFLLANFNATTPTSININQYGPGLGCETCPATQLTVTQGQKIFFRIRGNNGVGENQLSTNPHVYYNGTVHEFPQNNNNTTYKDSYLLSDDRGLYVRRSDCQYTDYVLNWKPFQVNENAKVIYELYVKDTDTTYSLECPAGQITTMSVEAFFNTANIPTFSIYKTKFKFRVYTDGNKSAINWENVQWRPSLIRSVEPELHPRFYPIPNYDNYVYDFLLGNDEKNKFAHLGPLNRGWGQFAYNDANDIPPNETDPVLASDEYGKLINLHKVNNPLDYGVNGGFIGFEEGDFEDIDNDDDIEDFIDANFDQINPELYENSLLLPVKKLKPYRDCENCTNYVCDNTGIVNTSFVEKWYGLNLDQYISASITDPGVFDVTSDNDTDGSNSTASGAGLPTMEEPENEAPEQAKSDKFGMTAITKLTSSESRSTVFGASVVKHSNSKSNYSHSLSDFVDLNGDGYPDIITEFGISITDMAGGHQTFIDDTSLITQSESWNKGWGVGSIPTIASAAGRLIMKGIGFDTKSDGDSGDPAGHLSMGGDVRTITGENTPSLFFQDVNGDGLTDRILCEGCEDDDTPNNYKVIYNNGSLAFNFNTSPNVYQSNFKGPNSSGSSAFSLSLGSNFSLLDGASGSISAGLSLGVSSTRANPKILHNDINGDGLADIISFNGSSYTIKYNLGNSFSNSFNFDVANDNDMPDSHSVTTSASMSGNISGFFSFGIWGIYIKGGATASGSYNLSISDQDVTYKDFNGDGYIDLLVSDGNNAFKVYLNKIGKTNMLKTVHNFIGGDFVMDYKVITPTAENPNTKWVLSSVKVNDGYNFENDGEDIYRKKFIYGNAHYDRRERSFYGFDKVSTQDIKIENEGEENEEEIVYRTNVSEYYNTSYFNNGLLTKSYMIKGEEIDDVEPEVYSITENGYTIKTINNNWEINNNPTTFLDIDTFDVGGTEGRKQAIVLLQNTLNEVFAFSSDRISSTTNIEYDNLGRVINYTNQDASDTYISNIKYHENATLTQNNLLNLPQQITVTDTSGTILRKRETDDIDFNTGAIGIVKTYYDETNFAQTNIKYDAFGNLEYIEYPENENGERMNYIYTFDPDLHKYTVEIKDAFGYVSRSNYDPRFDVLTESTDIAGNTMIYKYDDFGRVQTITGPKELENGADFTIAYEYYRNQNELTNFSAPLAITRHYDPQFPLNTMDTYSFTDGIGRSIQVKKDIELETGEAMSISGMSKYDVYGRTVEQFHPNFEIKDPAVNVLVNQSTSNYSSTINLDEVDRTINTTDPEGNQTNFKYNIANDGFDNLSLETITIVDQNEAQQIINFAYDDIKGRKTSTKQIGPDGAVWTKFKYNNISELTSYVDDQNIETSYKYDLMGRKIMVTSPDYGTSSFIYDSASNLIAQQTANLASVDKWVNFKYEINRLESIQFPEVASGENISNVTYKYGDTGNSTGRVIIQQDATGTQAFEYGNMGEVISIERNIVTPINNQTFLTNFEYDTWNRLQTIIYPDGEIIKHRYNLGGNIIEVLGEVNGSEFPYLKEVTYDHYEQPINISYGNGTNTAYTYSPSLRRLARLEVKNGGENIYLDNSYKFDKIGNITHIENRADVSENNLLGSYEHNYKYDVLNRLSYADGRFRGSSHVPSGDKNSDYALKMKYNNTHGIVNKMQNHNKNEESFLPNTYDNAYKYIDGTHKLENILDALTGNEQHFDYDLNGNLTKKTTNQDERTLYWDESNRLRVVEIGNSMQHYIYDAAGERALKANTSVEEIYENGQLTGSSINIESYTMYPSGYLVFNEQGRYTKHYYMGSTRIATQIGTGEIVNRTQDLDFVLKLRNLQKIDLTTILSKSNKPKTVTFNKRKPINIDDDDQEDKKAPETGLYFYHSDHLGTASIITDISGLPYQYFLNLPFGEEMAAQHSTTAEFSSRYKFNAKELDKETGWYYYGARYYDPSVGNWLSVDPLAEKYPAFSPYNYTMNNPIMLVDPDGLAPEDIIIKGANGSSVTLVTNLIDISVNASSLGLDFGGNYNLQGDDILSAGLDIVGIVDPTGIADGLNATLEAKKGNWLSAGISILGIIPYVGDLAKVGKIGKDIKIIDKAIDVVKAGRKGKAARLRELATDAKLGKADKGWIRQEINSVKRKSLRKGKDGKLRPQKNIRNPPGKDLAHPYKQRAKNGHSYKRAKLKNKLDHKQEHKIQGYK